MRLYETDHEARSVVMRQPASTGSMAAPGWTVK